MKLKWLLKGLCILWLTLLPISFSSSAWESLVEFDIPDTKIINSSTILFLNNLNFSSTYNNITMNRVIYFPWVLSSNWTNRNFGIFSFYDWKPYLYTAYVHDWNVSSSYQWFATKVCVASAWSGLSYCWNNWNYTDFNCSRLNWEDVSVFLNALGFTHWYIAKWQQWSSYAMNLYCFSNDINDYCFMGGAYQSMYCTTTLSGSVSLINHNPDNVNRISWSSSPFSNSVAPTPDSDIIYIWDWTTWTNKEYIDAFEERWYYKGLCYSDFYTWNLIDSNTQISDLFIGDLDDSVYYWHSVFDFYASENTDLSTHSRSQSRYALTKYTYDRDNLTPYIWKEKGTRNIMFNIYNNHFNDNFSWIDYRTYCDMIVNWYNPWDVFDWDVSQGMKDYVKRLEEEKSFILSWADVDFSWSKDLLGIFNWLYSRFKNAFPVDTDLSNKTTWILPTYVILGFFLFLLLYILKR